MKTCYCCSNTVSNVVSLPYFNFGLCDFCTSNYYKFVKIINFFDK